MALELAGTVPLIVPYEYPTEPWLSDIIVRPGKKIAVSFAGPRTERVGRRVVPL